MMFLAQVSEVTPPSTLDGVLASMFYIFGIIAAGAAAYHFIFREKKKELPQPLLVQGPIEHVTKPVFDAHVQEVNHRFTKMTDDAKESAKVAAIGRSNIHQHIEASATETRKEIGKIKDDMADLPEKTINLLLKTKELNK